MADTDGNQFDRRLGFNILNHIAQMFFQIIAGIDAECAVIDRRTVGNHHQDTALFGPRQQAVMRPNQSLAVNVFLQQALAHHQAKIFARAPPWRIGTFIDDMAQIIEAARMAGFAVRSSRLRGIGRLSRRAS